MHKLFLIGLLAITGRLCAQVTAVGNLKENKTDQLFEVSNPDWLRHKFTIELTNKNRIIIELTDKQGLNYISNLDSLLEECYSKILLIQDSLKNQLTNKKIEIAIPADGNVKLRFREFPLKANTYTFQNNELYGLKTEQDTLVITGHYISVTPVLWSKKKLYLTMPYRITVLTNNIAELKGYLDGRINRAAAHLKNDWDQYNNAGQKDKWSKKYQGAYSINDDTKKSMFGRAASPMKESYLSPYLHFGIQNMQNLLTPSFAAGLDIFYLADGKRENHFQLFTENYFFFERTPGASTKFIRNQFLTFQYKSIRDIKTWQQRETVKYYQQFSLGYLIRRRGDYFEKHSFKMGLPGFEYKNLQLTPGIFFNDFFKNTSPTISLTLRLD